ncbi:MAG: hypothetical protein QM783_17585 [Phycisphaerales bacterium]
MTILDRTTGAITPEVGRVLDGPGILEGQKLVREAVVAPHVKEYAARLVMATHPGGQYGIDAATKYIRCGSSPRGAQALILGAKVKALIEGRYHVGFKDVQAIAMPVLRHRLLLNFEAEADRVDADTIVKKILAEVRTEAVKA